MKPETKIFYDENGMPFNELLLQIFNRMVLSKASSVDNYYSNTIKLSQWAK